MNNPQEWPGEVPSTFPSIQPLQRPYTSLSMLQKSISTIVLLAIGYCVLNVFDAWPDTVKRLLYEITIYLIPSPVIYALQAVMNRYSGAIEDATRFKRSDFGNQRAKAEAIQRILGHGPFPNALRKARSLSGLETILPVSKETGPPGLGNWDNSCYQNSILQGLASLPAFQEYIGKSLELCEETQVGAATHKALRVFLQQLGDVSARKTTLWTPAVLKSMDSWQQQDAQEYFSRVVETVEKEDIRCFQVLTKRASPGFETKEPAGPIENENIQMLENVSLNDKQPNTVVKPDVTPKPDQESLGYFPRSPMDGMLAQALECQTCGFSEGYSLTQFNCLTVNLGLRGHSYLEDLLDEYTDPEMIDGVECTKCTKALADGDDAKGDEAEDDMPSPSKRPKLKPVHRTKAKQITIGRLPTNLVIHVNRSILDEYGNQRKNNSLIRFPAQLDFLTRWCAPLSDEEDKVQRSYQLKCSVTHYGRHENGHYVALGKRDKEWYCFNDEIVTKMGLEEVVSRGNVFMLFYEAIDTVPSSEPQEISIDETASSGPATAKESLESSTSSAETEPLVLDEPAIPVTRVPPMRTASGTLHPTENQDVDPTAPAVAVS